MKRQLTEAAQVAKLIKAELKKHGIKCKAKSQNYSGGDSVRITVTDQPPWVMDKIESFTNKFQYGHFNGMEDIYEYSNSHDDIPQTKFLFINNEYSKELCQAAWDLFKAMNQDYIDYPECFEAAKEYSYTYGDGAWDLGDKLYKYLNGSDLYMGPEECYFKKERIAA